MGFDFKTLLGRQVLIPTAVGAAALSCGFAAGYIYGKKKGAEEFIGVQPQEVKDHNQMTLFDDDGMLTNRKSTWISLDEFEDFKKYLASEPKDGEALSLEEIESKAEPSDIFHAEPIPTISNIFTNDTEEWDWDLEMAKRIDTDHYVIHYDEFIYNETGYRQETVTYYQEDDILADTKDTPIYNYKSIMGDLIFGYGSNDKNVVYIRNDSMQMEWEVLLDLGSYQREALGLDVESDWNDQDSKLENNRKFRDE